MITAVQWLKQQLEGYGDPQFCEISWKELDELIQHAIEIEKGQISRAVSQTNMNVTCTLSGIKYEAMNGEEYYKTTFNND